MMLQMFRNTSCLLPLARGSLWLRRTNLESKVFSVWMKFRLVCINGQHVFNDVQRDCMWNSCLPGRLSGTGHNDSADVGCLRAAAVCSSDTEQQVSRCDAASVWEAEVNVSVRCLQGPTLQNRTTDETVSFRNELLAWLMLHVGVFVSLWKVSPGGRSLLWTTGARGEQRGKRKRKSILFHLNRPKSQTQISRCYRFIAGPSCFTAES